MLGDVIQRSFDFNVSLKKAGVTYMQAALVYRKRWCIVFSEHLRCFRFQGLVFSDVGWSPGYALPVQDLRLHSVESLSARS